MRNSLISRNKKNKASFVLKKDLFSNLLSYLFLIPMSFSLVYPILYMVSMAFRPKSDLLDPTVIWISSNLTAHNIITMWEQMNFKELLFNSIFLSVFSALISTAVCAITGYGFARFKFKEKGFWKIILFITIVLPPSVMSVASYLGMKDFTFFGLVDVFRWITGAKIEINLLDTPMVYFLPAIFGAGLYSGMFILIFMQFFKGFPKELEDSAYIDGAGPIKTFFKIVLPNMKPPVVVVGLLSTVWYWNDTEISGLYLTNMSVISKRLLTVYTDMVKVIGAAGGYGAYHEEVVYIQSAMLIAIVPMLILFIISQKVFVESVTNSGIVG